MRGCGRIEDNLGSAQRVDFDCSDRGRDRESSNREGTTAHQKRPRATVTNTDYGDSYD